MALFGDLNAALLSNKPIAIPAALASVKILPGRAERMTRGSTARPQRVDQQGSDPTSPCSRTGWWKEYTGLRETDCIARYSLVVTIAVPNVDIGIYTPVALQVGIPIKIEVATGQLHLR